MPSNFQAIQFNCDFRTAKHNLPSIESLSDIDMENDTFRGRILTNNRKP